MIDGHRPRILPVVHTLLLLLVLSPANAKKPAPPPAPAWKATEADAADQKVGMDALLAQDWAAAEAAFRKVLTTEPDCGQALTGLARALVMQGKPADALDPAKHAAGQNADQVEAHLWYARAAAATNDADLALTEAKAVLGLKPGNVDGQRIAQTVLVARKDYASGHTLVAASRAASNHVAWDCFDGILYADEDNLDAVVPLTDNCAHAPDATLYAEFQKAVADAEARKAAAAPPPPPPPPPAPPPPKGKKK